MNLCASKYVLQCNVEKLYWPIKFHYILEYSYYTKGGKKLKKFNPVVEKTNFKSYRNSYSSNSK